METRSTKHKRRIAAKLAEAAQRENDDANDANAVKSSIKASDSDVDLLTEADLHRIPRYVIFVYINHDNITHTQYTTHHTYIT